MEQKIITPGENYKGLDNWIKETGAKKILMVCDGSIWYQKAFNAHLEDIDKIIAASYDCSILGIMDYELPYYIKKDPSILDNLILLIDKANVDNVKYDKNDLKSVFNTYEDVVDGETSYGKITEWFYDGMKEVDPTIADKVMMSLQKVVQEEWDPYIGEGLDEALENNITILIEFN